MSGWKDPTGVTRAGSPSSATRASTSTGRPQPAGRESKDNPGPIDGGVECA